MEEIKDIIEILSLVDDEIKKNDKNASAILDLQDLKSLKCLYNKYIEEKEKNEKVKLYIQEKQKIQYKYALSKIECDEIMEILEEQ